MSGGSDLWLGLRRSSKDDPWVWPSGKAALFTRWGSQQPAPGDENCVYLNFAQAAWYNAYCGSDASTFTVLCYVKWREAQ